MTSSLETIIRNKISKQEQFQLNELLLSFAKEGITNRNQVAAIISVMCQEGLLAYRRVNPVDTIDFGYAFVPIKNKK